MVARRISLTPRRDEQTDRLSLLLLAGVLITMGLLSRSGLALMIAAFTCGLVLAGTEWGQAIQTRTSTLHTAFLPYASPAWNAP